MIELIKVTNLRKVRISTLTQRTSWRAGTISLLITYESQASKFDYLTKLWFDTQSSDPTELSKYRTILYATNHHATSQPQDCGFRFPAVMITAFRDATDFSLTNFLCIGGNSNFEWLFEPSSMDNHLRTFTSGTWHRMEYKQVAIPGATAWEQSSAAKYSITINDFEVWSKASFQRFSNFGAQAILKLGEQIIFSSKTRSRKMCNHKRSQISSYIMVTIHTTMREHQ